MFFNLEKNEKEKIINDLKKSYSLWREKNKEINKPFFLIHNDFEHLFLRDISGGALKLFIYLGFRSKYQTGESWESIDEISAFFGKDPRTISNWFEELENMGLVTRKQKGFKMISTTFLRPYGFFVNEYVYIPQASVLQIQQDIKRIKNDNYKLEFGLMFNYNFKEYTLVLICKQQDSSVYECIAYPDFEYSEENLNKLKLLFRSEKIKIDQYDIENSISTSNFPKISIYNNVLKYLKEENLN